MISVNQLSVQFGGDYLFDNITFLINQNDRIGLVGKNGAGKSTLLKVIDGQVQPESGKVAIPNDFKIGYLTQDLVNLKGKTVFQETYDALTEIREQDEKIKKLTQQLEERTDYESDEYMEIINQLNEANERFQLLGGASIEAEIEKVLLGLGFEESDFERPVQEFSGGWQMRIELAKILLQKPDALLLDEPTNHLDILSIQWLEGFLTSFEGPVMLVSHDRAFLDNVTNRTIEITLGRIEDYNASYSRYVELRKERKEQQMAAYENQQRQIAQTERFIERFRAKATKASQVQSRVKQLEKMERIEVEDEDKSRIHFRFPEAPRSGKVVVKMKDVAKRYGDNLVFKDVDFELERGENVAFVGRNGEGKSTLSKIIVGNLEHEGKMELGHNVKIGYYAQNQAETLQENKTVFQVIDEAAHGEVRKNIRNILGSFLFSGDDVEKKVSVLSGGERSRLALAKLLLEPVNLLVLDEPTNHLDMRSKDILKQALQNYNGAMILVSHDRDFLKGLSEKVYEFSHQQVKQHIGDVYDFLEKRKLNTLAELNLPHPEKATKKKSSTENKSRNKELYELDKQLKSARRKVEKAEQTVTELETELAKMDEQLKDPSQFKELSSDSDIFKKYDSVKEKLETAMKDWEKLSGELEKMESKREAIITG